MTKYLMVGLGGLIGSIARFWVAGYISNQVGTKFPYGTFAVNCSGSFLLGMIITILAEKGHWSANWTYLLPIGFIGAYTTFSTFEFETFQKIQAGEFLMAGLNVGLSVVIGFVSLWLGVIAGRLAG
jgi:fluoride exporter